MPEVVKEAGRTIRLVGRASQSNEARFVSVFGFVAVVAEGTGIPDDVPTDIGCRATLADRFPKRMCGCELRSSCRLREC